MKSKTIIFCTLFGIFLGTPAVFSAESISVEDLAETWSFYGMGSRKVEGRMFYMKEDPGSKGVMIVSPGAYSSPVKVRYEIMPMSAASVCVVMISASDTGAAEALTIPAGYDGAMGHWTQNVDNYFFAFHNAAHDRTPFGVRFPGGKEIGEFGENVMRAGEFYTVEAGQDGERLWLKINGKRIFEGRDEDPLKGGHVAFRIRGISEEPASCLIRNVEVDVSGN